MSYDCQAIQYNEFTTEMLNEVNTKSNNFTDITTEKDSLFLDIKTQFKCFWIHTLVSAALVKLSIPDGEDH